MAGDWMKFEANTPEKPEVLAITVSMGWDDPDLTVGKLIKVWRWFDQQTVDGNAAGVTPQLLDRLLGVSGLCMAMQKVGWLSVTDVGVGLPNFDRHNGKSAKDRALTAKRVAAHKSNAKANAGGNADNVTDALPREEKRREEINTPIPPAKTPGAAAAVSLQTWLTTIKAMGEQPMPESDPVFDYAEQAGIPMEYMRLCWVEFKQRYSAPGAKKYKDWRSVYRKAVRGNWFKLWRLSNDSYVLTTEGQQALRVAEAKAVAA